MNKILRFLWVGIMVFAINIGWTFILRDLLGFSSEWSYAIAIITITVLQFFLSLRVTFKTHYHTKILIKYIFFLIAFASLNYLGTMWVKNIIGEQYLYGIILLITGLLLAVKFYVYDTIVFTHPKKIKG